MSLHEGHRARAKENFLAGGLDSLDDLKVLELLLFYAIPRVDVNPIAHRLIDEFGTLDNIFDAPIELLTAVDGISQNAAILIKMIPQYSRRYMMSKNKPGTVLPTVRDAAVFMMPLFIGARQEHAYALYTNAANKVVGWIEISHGEIDRTELWPRKIVAAALKFDASRVYLAHNHPSGILRPSEADIESTELISAALNTVNVTLIDHFIFIGEIAISVMNEKRYKTT